MINLKELILTKDNLIPLLRKLGKEARLIAPVQNTYGDTLFTEISDLDATEIDLSNQPQASLKPFLLPQQETLAHYSIDQDGYTFTPPKPEQATIYFGVRSCDLTAVLYMDLIFSKPTKDSNYYARRNQSLIISLGCNDPFANCFCEATGSGPSLEYGYDLQLIDIGDCYFVSAGRRKGADLLKKWGYFFREVDEEDRKIRYQLLLEARGKFTRNVQVAHACRRLEKHPVPETIWNALSRRCYDCGGCAYVCPTCTCFSVDDMALNESEGLRLRSWDACTSSGFTRMAGGHNPVDRRHHALKRRFLHKLKDDFSRHGKVSCTGCGRCIDICFGGVDITTFIHLVTTVEVP
ncbi:MAG: 4Fe-4S dicluster domain-containing protein [Proteobacteria bacterium]|nr:4Fe-4S dicluster domain-containing protein [Pseudomonadota bacterium]MBU1057884.1 4Fe-4S dicluster domain-containing protein [Pseudomonadota bacterium]